VRHETDDERMARLEAKGAQDRYFRRLELAATVAKPTIAKTKPRPPIAERTRPDNCVSCKRPMRGSTPGAAGAPGTVKHGRDGLCASCVYAKDNGRESATPRRAAPKKCESCRRPFRPRGARAADHPGTVSYKADGLCATDWRNKQKEQAA
jgi:hypothetical protein